MKNFKLKKQKT